MKQLLQKLHYFIFISLILFQNCKSDKKVINLLEGYLHVDEKQNLSATQPFLVFDFDATENYKMENRFITVDSDTIDINPFKEYAKRSFFPNGIASKYFINEIPGHMFKDNHDGTFQKISLKRFVKNYGYPEIKLVDKVYLNDRVTKSNQLNASAKIIGVNIDKESIIELTLKDETAAYLQDSLINDTLINEFISRLNPTEVNDYYFAQGVTISSVYHRVYTKQKFEAKIDYSYITASKTTYGSKDNFKSKLDVSLELTKLGELYKTLAILQKKDTIPK